MMSVPISKSLQSSLETLSKETGEPTSQLVADAISHRLCIPLHTLFQVSTSAALVQRIYERALSSNLLLNYGDFGLGTFENLDGEMVVLDGAIYQVCSDGEVAKIVGYLGTPFVVVTHFIADQDQTIENESSFEELTGICNGYRDSDNLFYAFRIDGHFGQVHTCATKETLVGLPMAEAAAIQPEFKFRDVDGTLVGIWAPRFSSALDIAGYHFHFLSEDRSKGGHLVECSGKNLRVRVERLNDFYLSLPESEDFLRADPTKDPSKDLSTAEQIQKREIS